MIDAVSKMSHKRLENEKLLTFNKMKRSLKHHLPLLHF